MLSEFLKKNIESQAAYIKANGYGYGQVEPNHLSAQATKEVYAQLPAEKNIVIVIKILIKPEKLGLGRAKMMYQLGKINL